jgi:multicomponent Na+:H+ antiporter subunit E
MTHLLLNILLALMWALLSGVFDPTNLLFGFVLGYFLLYSSRRVTGRSNYFVQVPRAIFFLGWFLKEMIWANLRVAADVLTPKPFMRPRIIGLPLAAHTHAEITLLANLISLTPGTLSLDISNDRRMLFIHAMYADDPDQVRRDIKMGLERRLLELMRGTNYEVEDT